MKLIAIFDCLKLTIEWWCDKWNLRTKSTDGKHHHHNWNTKPGERMYLNWTKPNTVWVNGIYVESATSKEKLQGHYTHTTSKVGINSQKTDTTKQTA